MQQAAEQAAEQEAEPAAEPAAEQLPWCVYKTLTSFFIVRDQAQIPEPKIDHMTLPVHLHWKKVIGRFSWSRDCPAHTSNFARQLLCQYTSQPCQIKRPGKSFLQRQLPLSLLYINLAIQPHRSVRKKASLKMFQNRQLPSKSDTPKSIKMTPLSKPFELGDLLS
jgi:hypothetical protein